jgi:hypothetical protein
MWKRTRASDHLIHCTACKTPLPAIDDEKNVLKYFLVGRARGLGQERQRIEPPGTGLRVNFTRRGPVVTCRPLDRLANVFD